ncbi:unnamed protein product [Miscanthus lutarioriparius]|uniref:Uncharacterized protein n=1 Tax=Miscanthus lutarioriparius TaxID=422564 RepID=A0A811QAR7_9POAL|nr:unnamed protein product [Miscanthus lutarioriparius]
MPRHEKLMNGIHRKRVTALQGEKIGSTHLYVMCAGAGDEYHLPVLEGLKPKSVRSGAESSGFSAPAWMGQGGLRKAGVRHRVVARP